MAIDPDMVVTETVVVLRGRVVEAAYDLAAGGPVCALNIPAGQWHTLRALESGTVILEISCPLSLTLLPAISQKIRHFSWG